MLSLLKLSAIRRGLAIVSLLLTIGSILILVGTFYTADHFTVQSVTTGHTVSPQGVTITLTFDIHNAGLYDVGINLLGRILSAQHEVIRNSTSWIITAGSGGHYTFTMSVDNATGATYFTPLAPQPIFDFTLTGRTAYGFMSLTLAGQRPINMTGG